MHTQLLISIANCFLVFFSNEGGHWLLRVEENRNYTYKSWRILEVILNIVLGILAKPHLEYLILATYQLFDISNYTLQFFNISILVLWFYISIVYFVKLAFFNRFSIIKQCVSSLSNKHIYVLVTEENIANHSFINIV